MTVWYAWLIVFFVQFLPFMFFGSGFRNSCVLLIVGASLVKKAKDPSSQIASGWRQTFKMEPWRYFTHLVSAHTASALPVCRSVRQPFSTSVYSSWSIVHPYLLFSLFAFFYHCMLKRFSYYFINNYTTSVLSDISVPSITTVLSQIL